MVTGTALDNLFFALIVSWKATANAFAMPFLMMHLLKALEKGYLREEATAREYGLRKLSQELPNRMRKEHGLSHMKQRQLSETIKGLLDGAETARKSKEPLDPQELFEHFLNIEGGSELQLGVFGLAETCFGSLFHAYENFVTRCIGVAKGNPDYRAFTAKRIETDARAEFGDDVAEYCLTSDPIQVARSVRNSLAHNGGKPDPNLEKRIAEIIREGFFIEDDKILVVANNVRSLFNVLKQRVQRLIEKAVKMPQFKAPGAG